MYAQKRGRAAGPRDQARDVLLRTMHAKQPELDDHSSEVADLAVQSARQLGLTGEQLDEVARAAELHDVGKVGIPDTILNKPGPLDATEWEFMRQHTILGERILNAAPALRPVAQLVRSSHERWDGTGYPDQLAGEAIPLGARIVAVCDAYEAMTADRAYRKALLPHAARQELSANTGTQFDPAVVAAFLAAVNPDQAERVERHQPHRRRRHRRAHPRAAEAAGGPRGRDRPLSAGWALATGTPHACMGTRSRKVMTIASTGSASTVTRTAISAIASPAPNPSRCSEW